MKNATWRPRNLPESNASIRLVDNDDFLRLAEGRTAPPTAYDHRRATGTITDKLIRQIIRLYAGVKLEDDHAGCEKLEMLNWQGDPLSD